MGLPTQSHRFEGRFRFVLGPNQNVDMRSNRARLAIGLAGATLSLAIGLVLPLSKPSQAASAYRLVPIAKATSPVGVVWNPVTKEPFVIEQRGTFRGISAGKIDKTPALDVTKEISDGGEQGLLGATFSNDATSLFVNLTNKDGDTEIRKYSWKDGKADQTSMRLILRIDQPYSNHNGGNIVVDENGWLWIGTGDGGSAGDPEARAQNLDSLLGKMLRIDPTPDGSGKQYSIPPTNPFVQGGGRPEIWASGLRNPWRYDLDRANKRLWIGDVGQGDYEEVNVIGSEKGGANFGWDLREGTHPFEGGKLPPGATDPVYEYSHSKDGCSITGGVVYRGTQLRGLAGSFLFGDYCQGWIGLLTERKGKWSTRRLGLKVTNVSSFNRAPNGEVWVTSTQGSISQIDRK